MRGAEETFCAALGDPPVAEAHQVGIDRVGRTAHELRPRAHRVADSLRRVREQVRGLGEARREGRDPAAVDRDVDVVPAEQLCDPLLQRMRAIAVRMERPAVRATRREHPRVLPGAVVPELAVGPALLQSVLEIVDGCACARQHLSHCRQLRRLRAMRRAGDRDLVVAEIVVAFDERDRLDGLRRRPEEERQPRVAPALAVRRGGVDPMHRLDDVAATDLDGDRFHRGNLDACGAGGARSPSARPGDRVCASDTRGI